MPRKVKIFALKAINSGGLPTSVNKWRRKLDAVGTCKLCGAAPESGHHALVVCPPGQSAEVCYERMRSLEASRGQTINFQFSGSDCGEQQGNGLPDYYSDVVDKSWGKWLS